MPEPAATQDCADCGARLTGPYCATCGQRVVQDADFSLLRLTREWVTAMFSVDSRGLTTLRRLLFSPGRLSADYIAGRRSATFGPFQIFVIVTLIFFLLPDNVDVFKAPARFFFGQVDTLVALKMAALDMSRDELAIAHDARVGGMSKLGLIVMAVPLCLVSWAMGFRRMPHLGKHLVIAIHSLIFIMILLGVALGLFAAIMVAFEFRTRRIFGFLIVLTVIAFYLSAQQRRVLGSPIWLAGLKGSVLMLVFLMSSAIYRYAVSWLSLWSL